MSKNTLTQVSIDVINNTRLSWAEKGIYIFMQYGFLQKEDETLERLVECSRNGEYATSTLLRELINKGYVRKVVKKAADNTFKKFYYEIK